MTNLIPLPTLSTYLRRPDAPSRVSASDCEWRRCPSCYAKGYGPDSWLPVTSEYWAVYRGHLILSQCKACRSEVTARRKGFVPEGMAA